MTDRQADLPTDAPRQAFSSRQVFPALHHPGFRIFFIGTVLAFMADSIEHVISYWMVFQKFHSPALGGFAVVSHWAPFLFLSVFVGALNDRFDSRRLIQAGMLCFMAASLAWGVLFLTDSLQVWEAQAILVVHGLAGVLWMPSTQMLIHDIVGPELLPSAVRLNATARWIGFLAGPAIGGALMVALGPSLGILVNALIYLPLVVWLWRAPYGPRFRAGAPALRPAIRGIADILAALAAVGSNRILLAITLLAGSVAFFIGTGYQPQMPAFANDLGHGDPGILYSMLLAADASGALIAGIILESTGFLPPRPRTAVILTFLWSLAIIAFAMAQSYAAALVFLFAAGFLELSFNSMAQTLVQLNAPAPVRGRVIGLFNMAALGLRTFSGFTIGVGGKMVGVHWSLGLSATAVGLVMLSLFTLTGQKAPAPASNGD